MNTRHHPILFASAILLASLGSTLAATHYVDQHNTNSMPPYTNWATAATNIQVAVDAAVAGDEVVVTNGTYATGGRNGNRVNVDKWLSIRSVNGPQLTTIDGSGLVRCAYLTNSASLSGFTLFNGYVDPGGPYATGGGLFCQSTSAAVSNCILTGNLALYGGGAAGGTLNSCTLSNNAVRGQGSYGASGGGAYYCTLNNCTLSSNRILPTTNISFLAGGGAGAVGCTLNNCWLTGNSAGQGNGGGADDCTLDNCILSGNSATYGGGAADCMLNNCTLTGNLANAGSGGGAFGGVNAAGRCWLNNCIVYYNWPNNYDVLDPLLDPSYIYLYYCCTTPDPADFGMGGIGNITNAPLFVDTNSWANLRLQSNSPCIRSGGNFYVTSATDLDGNPRIVGGAEDIGAYEYQSLSLINFSVVSNQAGFSITGQSNQVVIVETSTDLANWSPLATNTLNGHPFPFSDPAPASLPRRFYRAQAQ
jgi:hypothetical protein